MHPFKKMILSTVVYEQNSLPSSFKSALRSNLGYQTVEETNICLVELDRECIINTQVNNTITTGDIMYNSDGVTPFNGGLSVGGFFAYYNVKLVFTETLQGSKICYIDNAGVINVVENCPI
jgi:hypothetical protein